MDRGSAKYYVKNPLLHAYLKTWDFFLSRILLKADQQALEPLKWTKVLVVNSGHIGDVILSVSFLSALQKGLPNVKIGLLVGSWAVPVVQGDPLVERIHVIDHWRQNRRDIAGCQKVGHYLASRVKALKEIRQVEYDAAISLIPFYPNLIPAIWQARIPVRIGYTSGGFGPMLTKPREFDGLDTHIVNSFLELVRPFIAIEDAPGPARLYSNGSKGIDSIRRVEIEGGAPYAVVHIGTGAKRKSWPEANWKALAATLERELPLVFTGAGTEEDAAIKRIIAGLPRCVNLCNKLNWHSFVETIKHARILIGVDSAAGHAAAAVRTPAVLVYSGIAPHMFRPLGSQAQIVTAQMDCSPCFHGCPSMRCMQEVSVDAVREEIWRALNLKTSACRSLPVGAQVSSGV